MRTQTFPKAAALTALLIPAIVSAAGAQQTDRSDGLRFVPNVIEQFKALTELERRCFGLGIGLLGTSWLAVGRRLAPRKSS